MSSDATVCVAYRSGDRVAAMRVGGMSVLERVLREASRSGAARAVVHADREDLPALPDLPIHVEIIPAAGSAPAGVTSIAGNIVAGVQISDEQTRRAASRALLQTCRRPFDGVGDRYVIRGISLRLTRVFARIGATPNQVTLANIAVGLTACGFAQHGTRLAFAIAGALMVLQVVLDSCDGELARIRFMGSKLGMWMDNVSDDVIDNLFIAMLGVGLGGIWMPIGIAAASARGLCALMIYLELARAGRPGDVMSFAWWFDKAEEALTERYEVAKPSPLAIVRGVGRRDLYVLIYGATCMVGIPVVGLVIGSAVGGSYFVLAIAHLYVTRRRSAASVSQRA
jgi:phosphatidylglycerophosphate synthase